MPGSIERIRVIAVAVALLGAACTPQAGEAPVSMPRPASGLAVAPDFAGTIWAATGRKVYRSRDGGHTWRRVPGRGGATGVAFLSTHVVAVGPDGVQVGGFGAPSLGIPRRVEAPFVAVATPYYRTSRLYAVDSAGHLWVSVRNAQKWARLRAAGLPAGAVAVAAIRADVHHPDVIYVACGAAGLWRSKDFGATFKRIPRAGPATAVAATTDDQKLLLVASPAGIELSRNFGRSFTHVSSVAGVGAIAFDLRNWRLAYAALANGQLLRSDDGGASWDAG
jgi:photosystem II stability/assembly factor-like uncharacterized protein